MKYVLGPGARDDLREAVEFYGLQRAGLGSEFASELGIGLAHIMDGPARWPEEVPSVHRYRLDRFPYGVFYRYDARTKIVRVLAILDLRRDPGAIARRVTP